MLDQQFETCEWRFRNAPACGDSRQAQSVFPARRHSPSGDFRRPIRCLSPALLSLTMMLALGSLGCGGRDEVRVFSIPKQAEPIRAAEGVSPPATVEPLQARMLAAILRGGSQVWFFKMLGAPDDVAAAADGFRSLLTSVKFNDRQEPTWTLPNGWTEESGSGMRLATLRAGKSPNAPSVSVVGLAPPQDTRDNVNRWRSQLQLSALDASELADAIEVVQAGELPIELIDISGTADPENTMVAPFASASGLPNPHTSAALPSSGNPPSSAGFKYKVPTGWNQQAASGMRRAYFSVADGEKSADITVITLSVSNVLDNINRWRGELQLEPISESELDQHAAALTLSGTTGTWINRIESRTEPRRATIAAMVEHDGQMWFFKITGPADLVAREEDNFRSFVESVEF